MHCISEEGKFLLFSLYQVTVLDKSIVNQFTFRAEVKEAPSFSVSYLFLKRS